MQYNNTDRQVTVSLPSKRLLIGVIALCHFLPPPSPITSFRNERINVFRCKHSLGATPKERIVDRVIYGWPFFPRGESGGCIKIARGRVQDVVILHST